MYWTCLLDVGSGIDTGTASSSKRRSGKHACSNKALSFDDLETGHTTAVTIQAVLLIVLMIPAAYSLHFAAVLSLPADTGRVLFLDSGPTLFIELFPGQVGSLIVAQLSPVLAGRTDTAKVFGREITEYLMHTSRRKRSD